MRDFYRKKIQIPGIQYFSEFCVREFFWGENLGKKLGSQRSSIGYECFNELNANLKRNIGPIIRPPIAPKSERPESATAAHYFDQRRTERPTAR